MICHYCEKEIKRGDSFAVDCWGRPYHPECWPRAAPSAHEVDYVEMD